MTLADPNAPGLEAQPQAEESKHSGAEQSVSRTSKERGANLPRESPTTRTMDQRHRPQGGGGAAPEVLQTMWRQKLAP